MINITKLRMSVNKIDIIKIKNSVASRKSQITSTTIYLKTSLELTLLDKHKTEKIYNFIHIIVLFKSILSIFYFILICFCLKSVLLLYWLWGLIC